MMNSLNAKLGVLPGFETVGLVFKSADDFAYTYVTEGSVSAQQGVRIRFHGGSRIVFRLSGKGMEGATLRVFLERYQPGNGLLDLNTEEGLAFSYQLPNNLLAFKRISTEIGQMSLPDETNSFRFSVEAAESAFIIGSRF